MYPWTVDAIAARTASASSGTPARRAGISSAAALTSSEPTPGRAAVAAPMPRAPPVTRATRMPVVSAPLRQTRMSLAMMVFSTSLVPP